MGSAAAGGSAEPFILPGESLSKYRQPEEGGVTPAASAQVAAKAQPKVQRARPSTEIDLSTAGWDGGATLPGESLARRRNPEPISRPEPTAAERNTRPEPVEMEELEAGRALEEGALTEIAGRDLGSREPESAGTTAEVEGGRSRRRDRDRRRGRGSRQGRSDESAGESANGTPATQDTPPADITADVTENAGTTSKARVVRVAGEVSFPEETPADAAGAEEFSTFDETSGVIDLSAGDDDRAGAKDVFTSPKPMWSQIPKKAGANS